MQSPVIDVGRNALLSKVVHSVHLLLVADEMLDRRDDSLALDAFDGKRGAKC